MNVLYIRDALERNSIPFTDDLPRKLNIYLSLLKEWNEHMDLTAVTEDDEMLDKHFIDSLTVLKTSLIPEQAALIDVGTGAGFPGMVLAIARPDIHVTLLDSQKKRLSFLEKIASSTDTHITAFIHARAEDAARMSALREEYDIATARALAPLNILSEYLLPFLRINGCALCWKGPALKEEMEYGRKAVHLLGGRLEMPVNSQIYGRDWEHTILPIRKIHSTPAAYPRKAGIPKSKPLGI